MFNANTLWRERLGQTSKELGKYLRYIFNGHIVIVLVFLIGTASFYYQEWVQTLKPDFPVSFIMAIFISLLLTHSPIYTFLMEADRVFLLPLESKLTSYFRRSIAFSFFVQVYGLIVGLAVFMPMYAQVNNGDFKSFFLFLAMLLFAKIANLMIRWKVQYYVETSIHTTDLFVRYFVNGVFLYLLFSSAIVWFFLPVILIFAGLYYYYHVQTRSKGLKWEFLIEQEEKRMMFFYRLANMFTEVPQLRNAVKRRKWLDWILNLLPYKRERVYMYLHVHTFIRGGEYLGLFLRLTIIGAVPIYFLAFGYSQILFVLLFLFLTGFQLFPLWNHHQNKIWLQLYPVNDRQKGDSFQKLLLVILSVQTLLLSVPLFLKGEWLTSLLAIACGLVFSFFFVFVYMNKKLKN